MGLSLKNLVHNPAELREQAARIKQGYKGWKLSDDGLFVEAFINGPEFTVFISGSADDQDHVHIYPGLEASFHESLPEKERFLSFDRLWSVYEEESPLPEDEYFFHYIVPEEAMQQKLSSLALEAYRAVGGKGYCRVDIRMDKTTAKLYVLEVNAQCGISEDPDYSSIGDIIKVAGQPFCKLVEEILLDGLRRYELQNPPPNP
jgi:D-alanine-D-alanine ligase